MGKWLFAGYTLAAGVLMSVFVMTPGLFRHVFSLCALLVGIQFFKREEEKKPRIWFVVLVFVLALFLPILYVMVALANGWNVNPEYLEK